jgi:hypothetical protein
MISNEFAAAIVFHLLLTVPADTFPQNISESFA